MKIIFLPSYKPNLYEKILTLFCASILFIGLIIHKYFHVSVNFCQFKKITGIPCFFCGSSRAFFKSLTFNFKEAILLHPVGFLIFWLCVLILLRCLLFIVLGKYVVIKTTKSEKVTLAFFLFILIFMHWLYAIKRV